MKSLLPKIDGLYDIQPPAAPPPGTLEWLLIIFISSILLALVSFLAWKILFSRKRLSHRKIRQLKKLSEENKHSPRETVYLLSDFVRTGLGLTCLTQNTLLPSRLPVKIKSLHSRWSGFTCKLDQLRYRQSNISQQDIDYLFNESLFWLRNWP